MPVPWSGQRSRTAACGRSGTLSVGTFGRSLLARWPRVTFQPGGQFAGDARIALRLTALQWVWQVAIAMSEGLTPREESLQEGLERLGRVAGTSARPTVAPVESARGELDETRGARTDPPVTTAIYTDRSHDGLLRYAMRLALAAGIAAVVAGFIWASTLGATPDWSSWSDRGAALLIAGGAVTVVACGIVVIGRHRRIEKDRLLWSVVSFLFASVAGFAMVTIAAVVVELLLDLIGLRDFSWETLYDFLDDVTVTG